MMGLCGIAAGEAENLKYAISNAMKTTKIETNCLDGARMKKDLLWP
jgi:hypothetical protein